MRRRLTVRLTLTVIVALSAPAAFANSEPFTAAPHAVMGPQYHQKMVVRRDVGTDGTQTSTNNPSDPGGPGSHGKPLPVIESVRGPGRSLSGRDGNGSIPVGTASPQMRLESSLKSLAQELR